MVTTGHLTRLARAGGPSQEVARDQEPLLQQVRRECEEEGHQWTEAGLEAVTQLVGGLVTPDQRARTLVRAGLQLVTALHLAHTGSLRDDSLRSSSLPSPLRSARHAYTTCFHQ